MSEENVELTRLVVAAWERRDVDAMVALWDPEGVWHPALEGVAKGRKRYRGHTGVRQYFEDLGEFSNEGHIESPEYRDLGDRVLGVGRISMRFTSGVELDEEIAMLHTWRNGKCVEARSWMSHAESFEAAGLEE